MQNVLSLTDFLLLTCSKANHPNIVKLLGNITLKDQKWVIPLEFIFGEDLETTIFKSAKSKVMVSKVNRFLFFFILVLLVPARLAVGEMNFMPQGEGVRASKWGFPMLELNRADFVLTVDTSKQGHHHRGYV